MYFCNVGDREVTRFLFLVGERNLPNSFFMAGKSDPVRKCFLVSVVERWDPYEEAPYPPGAEVGLEPSDLRILRRIVRSKSSAVFAHALFIDRCNAVADLSFGQPLNVNPTTLPCQRILFAPAAFQDFLRYGLFSSGLFFARSRTTDKQPTREKPAWRKIQCSNQFVPSAPANTLNESVVSVLSV